MAEEATTVYTVNGLMVAPHYSIEDAPPIVLLIIPGGVGARAI